MEDRREKSSQIDNNTVAGLELADDGSLRLVLQNSGEALPDSENSTAVQFFGDWHGHPITEAIQLPGPPLCNLPKRPQRQPQSRVAPPSPPLPPPSRPRPLDGQLPLPSRQKGHPLQPRSSNRPQRTIARIIRWIGSIFKKKSRAIMLHNSVEEEATNSQTTEQTKPYTEVGLGATNIGLAHVFSYQELYQATHGFTQEIGDGGFSRVYLGKLQDNRIVAVKVLYEGIPKRMEQYLNEVTVLSRLRHKNLVALYGCTDPETQKLLLVYEFVPNGTLAGHLHGQLQSLTWYVRMQIAIETAEGLSYLHSCEPPIIHRDVKTSNILLDNDFHAKVADLGMCRLVPWDTTSVSTMPQGTVGYRDPEYDELCKLTLKSDVYSFGVVLLELISGKPAVDVNREEADIYLFKMAVKKILNKELEQLVDSRLGYGSDFEISRMISSVAAVACVCLQPKANPRPSMVQVLAILKGLKDGKKWIL